MKHLFAGFLLVLAFLMISGSGFEISGMMGAPNLPWAIALSLAAQVAVLRAGFITSLKNGELGFIRAIGIIFYLVESLALPVLVFVFLTRDSPTSNYWTLTKRFGASFNRLAG